MKKFLLLSTLLFTATGISSATLTLKNNSNIRVKIKAIYDTDFVTFEKEVGPSEKIKLERGPGCWKQILAYGDSRIPLTERPFINRVCDDREWNTVTFSGRPGNYRLDFTKE
jgi:hypothetical protein